MTDDSLCCRPTQHLSCAPSSSVGLSVHVAPALGVGWQGPMDIAGVSGGEAAILLHEVPRNSVQGGGTQNHGVRSNPLP